MHETSLLIPVSSSALQKLNERREDQKHTMYVFVFWGHKNKNSTKVLEFDAVVYENDLSVREIHSLISHLG